MLKCLTISAYLCENQNELRHDKTNKVSVCPAKTQISLGIRPVWSESSLSAWRNLGPSATHWAHSVDSDQTGWMPRLWSDWADAQADLSLRWAHTHFVRFVMSWLKLWTTFSITLLNWQQTVTDYTFFILSSKLGGGGGGGHIGFRLFVHACIHSSHACHISYEPCMLGFWNFIYGFLMEK